MKICIAGQNSIAVNSLDYLINDLFIPKDNILVITNKNDSGTDHWQPSLKKYSIDNDLKIVDLNELYDYNDLIFISLQFDKIIKPGLFKTAKLYNLHFSFLPEYKGVYTGIMPILNGESMSGVTLHYIDEGIDTGDIIAQERLVIDIDDTSRSLYHKYLESGYNLFIKNIKSLINGNISSFKQQSISSSYYSKGDIDLNNICIDLNKTSFQIHNQVRAFIFEEYQLPEIKGKKIFKSILTSEKSENKQMIEYSDHFIISGVDGFKIIMYKK